MRLVCLFEDHNPLEGVIFLNDKTAIVGQEHGQRLNLKPQTLRKVQGIAAKHGAWYEGDGSDAKLTKGQIDEYNGSWDDLVAKDPKIFNLKDYKWLYVLFTNLDVNKQMDKVKKDKNKSIFQQLISSAKENSYQNQGFDENALTQFLRACSEGEHDFLEMSQQPATKENLERFFKIGEALMWPSNWEEYPNKAGKIAKAATVDARDQFLASRKSGVYVTGSGHMLTLQELTNKKILN